MFKHGVTYKFIFCSKALPNGSQHGPTEAVGVPLSAAARLKAEIVRRKKQEERGGPRVARSASSAWSAASAAGCARRSKLEKAWRLACSFYGGCGAQTSGNRAEAGTRRISTFPPTAAANRSGVPKDGLRPLSRRAAAGWLVPRRPRSGPAAARASMILRASRNSGSAQCRRSAIPVAGAGASWPASRGAGLSEGIY